MRKITYIITQRKIPTNTLLEMKNICNERLKENTRSGSLYWKLKTMAPR